MRTSRFILLLAVTALALNVVRAEETDAEVAARNIALDLAGAFSNDGFKLRDGHWAGPVKQGEEAVVAVNLYAGNQYWFSVGANEEVKKFTVRLFDENGKPMEVEEYHAEATAAAGFSPTISGQYFVAISPTESSANAFCLVYSYK